MRIIAMLLFSAMIFLMCCGVLGIGVQGLTSLFSHPVPFNVDCSQKYPTGILAPRACTMTLSDIRKIKAAYRTFNIEFPTDCPLATSYLKPNQGLDRCATPQDFQKARALEGRQGSAVK